MTWLASGQNGLYDHLQRCYKSTYPNAPTQSIYCTADRAQVSHTRVWAVSDTLTDRMHACMCHKKPPETSGQLHAMLGCIRPLNGGPGQGSVLCNAVVVEFKSGKFGLGDAAPPRDLSRIVHLCSASTRLCHLSEINKLYLICTVMQCPISTHRFKKKKAPQWLELSSSGRADAGIYWKLKE